MNIAYQFDGGCVCAECAKTALANRVIKPALHCGPRDTNGIPAVCLGPDGRRVKPIDGTVSRSFAGLYCDTCCDEIVMPTPERYQA